MAIIRWDPLRDLYSAPSDMNRMFDRFFEGRPAKGEPVRWLPAMDLLETEDALVLRADLPGVKEDDVLIEVRENVLTISGARRAEHEERGEGFHRVERSFGRFSRCLSLPQGVDTEAIAASFSDGVLEVRVPKPPEIEPTHVEIDTGAPAVEGTGTEK
jgi:HSP20 family protein